MVRPLRRVLAVGACSAVALGAWVLAAAAPASADVTTEAEFTAAWEDTSTSSIALANDITLTCDSGTPFRNSSTSITVEGNGHVLHQSCPDSSVLSSHGSGAVTVLDITISGGHATGLGSDGGGIFSNGDLTVDNSTITDNQADHTGGGVVANGLITITNSTISDNSALGGGGVASNNLDNKVVIVNSTITGNAITDPCCGGGGISANDLTLVYSTVIGNSATIGANIFIHQGTFLFRSSFGSVVAQPQGGGDNCGYQGVPDTHSDGYNFSDDDSCGFTATGDRENAGDPLLGALGANGGPTLTMLPLTGSPLIDAIPVASCQASVAAGILTDQRGVTRPQGSGCDVGSVETQAVAPVPTPTPVIAPVRFTG